MNFLKDIKRCRNLLKEDRKKYWNNNKKNFEKNLMKIINSYKIPKPWKIYVVAGNFISNKKIMPYDWDSWSATLLICATKRQNYEIMLFFNRARSEFLSVPGLIRIVTHELKHVDQLIKNPSDEIKSKINDKFSEREEKEVETEVDKLPKEFLEQTALESVLYCYDNYGWEAAKKMADFFKNQETVYSGGYSEWMTKEEYNIFMKAKKEKNINLFINNY